MKRYFKITLALTALFFFCTLHVLAQMRVNFPDIFDAGDEYFQIQFTIDNNNVKDFVPPSFEDFNVLAGPFSSVSSSMSVVNGKMSRKASTTYTYTVSPKKTGTFTIGSASAFVDGKQISSPAKKIKIIGSIGSVQNGQATSSTSEKKVDTHTANAVSKSDMSIQIIPSKTKVFVQEPILLTYKFYAKPSVSLSQIGMHKKPDFKGMISQDLPMRNIQLNNEEINGEIYRSGIIQRYIVFPQSAGKIKVPGLIFDCDIFERNEMIDPFEAFFSGGGTISRTVQRKVEDISLDVLPLPQPQPTDFSGGVGNFDIQGEVLTTDLRTNDVISYRLTITGSGNLNLLTAPKLDLNDDFDVYAPKITDETKITEQGVIGKIVYDYTFVPRRVGDYVLPPFIFTFFDPSSETYKKVMTDQVKMHIIKGNKTNEEYERSQNLLNGDIRDLHNSEIGVKDYDDVFWWGKWFYWLSYLLLTIIAFIIHKALKNYLKINADVISKRSRKAGKMAVKRMRKAKSFMDLQKRDDFYTEVSHALYGYIANKYNLGTADLNRTHIEECLSKLQVDKKSIDEFIKILDECDFAQYAPSDQVISMSDLYEKAINCIVDIENQK